VNVINGLPKKYPENKKIQKNHETWWSNSTTLPKENQTHFVNEICEIKNSQNGTERKDEFFSQGAFDEEAATIRINGYLY